MGIFTYKRRVRATSESLENRPAHNRLEPRRHGPLDWRSRCEACAHLVSRSVTTPTNLRLDRQPTNFSSFYAGGGFALAALEGHLQYFMKLIKSRSSPKDLAVFFLTYTLAPTAKYPTQLRQAVEALRYIATETKRSPSQIIIGGDSAGGNLVAGVLSHLTHHHEAIDELKLSEPLVGAIMMAPWTALDPNAVQLGNYDGADIVTRPALKRWAEQYMGDAKPDYYTDASMAPPEWFRDFPVKKIVVLAGQNELLLPSINAFVKTIEVSFWLLFLGV